ncbi:hypothetical protein QTI66_17560 [Variovorax sp. J22R133]|uniref:hypothetical protein n=1 Tax=Variovorax brevis TaxID=3053503 RepID=UPI002574AD95|nr:hypothetical protein [Variovorax sp. J22R133]MDM0113966.1 hypothetical protein [Variovorax sp. J22R133]
MHLDLPAPRRFFTIEVLLALALSLAACGGGGSGGDAQSSSALDTASMVSIDAVAQQAEFPKPPTRAATDAGKDPPAQMDADALQAVASGDGPASTWALDRVAAIEKRNHLWGVAPSALLQTRPATWLPAMSDAGVTTVRGFIDEPGNDQLAPIADAGMSAVGYLMWSSSTPFALPVDDLRGWRRYVTEQLRRHKGRVKYWEVWNEPPNFTADPSPASYAKVVAVAYHAAKAVDPTVQIGLSAKSNHVAFLAESLAAGAAGKYDFVTLHPYEVASLLSEGWEGQFMSIVPRVRKLLQDKDPAKAAVPIWFTEIGFSANTSAADGVGPQMQADALAKIYTMSIAQGVARVYWFDPSDSEGLKMGLTTADGTKRPAWYAMRSLRTWLGGQPRYAGWTQPGGAWYGFVFESPKGVVLSAWSRPGQSTVLSLPSEVTAVDPRTGAVTATRTPAITEAPALLIAAAGSAQASQWLGEAAASSGKPFPWNGDHSASRTVRMVAGATPDGVFIVKPPAISVVNNVAEYNLEGTIGACFAVDPTFMSYAYATRPIRITATVRGHGTGEPGFYMLYESDALIASADVNNLVRAGGWSAIKGTHLHEKTWTVPNALFVGQFGYNFCMYSQGAPHDAFSVQQVTVSR